MNPIIKLSITSLLVLVLLVSKAQNLDHYIYDHDTIVTDTDENIYGVENLGENINTKHMESGPIISPDGNTLYYFRVDTNYSHSKVSPAFHSDILFSEYVASDSSWTKAQYMDDKLNCECPNSVQSVVNNGNTLLLTNHYHPNGLNTKGLSVSHREADHWSFPKPLKVKFQNDQRFSAFMNNEMSILILGVNDKGSYGNQDLYVSFSKDKIHWTDPKNLGKTINTKESEGTAFLAADGKTLYFSSNGHPGSLGGFDIYKSERLDSSWSKWSTPENIGRPYNTKDNEFYFTVPSHGDYSYLAHHFTGSDKVAHSDIVRIRLNHKAKPKVLVIAGMITDSQTNENIPTNFKVTLINKDNTLSTGVSDTAHGYRASMPLGQQYKITFESPGYLSKEITVDATQLKKYTEKKLDVSLTHKQELVFSGFIYNAEESARVNGSLEIKNKATGELLYTLETTTVKSFQLTLPRGIEYEIIVSSPDLLEDIYYLDLTNLESRMDQHKIFSLHCLKCSFEVEDIFFAYNKADLNPQSYEKLDQMVTIMLKHPEIKVELSAHTDARGRNAYNKNLSQKRAESAVKYLVDHGIPAVQFTAIGYGEDKIRNKCTNGVACTEEEHENNRRIEFKVLDTE